MSRERDCPFLAPRTRGQSCDRTCCPIRRPFFVRWLSAGTESRRARVESLPLALRSCWLTAVKGEHSKKETGSFPSSAGQVSPRWFFNLRSSSQNFHRPMHTHTRRHNPKRQRGTANQQTRKGTGGNKGNTGPPLFLRLTSNTSPASRPGTTTDLPCLARAKALRKHPRLGPAQQRQTAGGPWGTPEGRGEIFMHACIGAPGQKVGWQREALRRDPLLPAPSTAHRALPRPQRAVRGRRGPAAAAGQRRGGERQDGAARGR